MKSEKPTRSDKQFYALGMTLLMLVSLLPALAYAMPSEKDWKQFNFISKVIGTLLLNSSLNPPNFLVPKFYD